MSAVFSEPSGEYASDLVLADDRLLDEARAGDERAFGDLFERYHRQARALAGSLTRRADPDDVVSEAFLRVFAAIRAGKGPTTNFAAYLFMTVRRQVIDQARTAGTVELTEGEDTDDGVAVDNDVALIDEVRRAMAKLPERWRLALWTTEVEGMKPREAASALGMSANSASALAYRAREGLRQAFLSEHLDANIPERCRFATESMPAMVRGGLTRSRQAEAKMHINSCTDCQLRLEALTSVNRRFAALSLPAALALTTPGVIGAAAAHGKLLSVLLAGTRTARSHTVATMTGAAAIMGTTGVVFLANVSVPTAAPPVPAPATSSVAAPTPSPTPTPTPSPTPTPTPVSTPRPTPARSTPRPSHSATHHKTVAPVTPAAKPSSTPKASPTPTFTYPSPTGCAITSIQNSKQLCVSESPTG